jgi:hypothetical protein
MCAAFSSRRARAVGVHPKSALLLARRGGEWLSSCAVDERQQHSTRSVATSASARNKAWAGRRRDRSDHGIDTIRMILGSSITDTGDWRL